MSVLDKCPNAFSLFARLQAAEKPGTITYRIKTSDETMVELLMIVTSLAAYSYFLDSWKIVKISPSVKSFLFQKRRRNVESKIDSNRRFNGAAKVSSFSNSY